MNRLLITHKADLDGAAPIILSKLIFNDMTYLSIDIDEVDNTLKKNIDLYDEIYITDLNISDDLASSIESTDYKNKVKIFDHHISNIEKNKYSFITVIEEIRGKKECGTTIYYNYLIEKFYDEILDKICVKHFIELVRQNDTWDFDGLKEESFKLNELYSIYGRDLFIDKFYKYLKNNVIYKLDKFDLTLLEIEEKNKKEYIEEKLEEMKIGYIDEYKVGIIFAEKYRSILGHEIVQRNPDIQIGIIINFSHGVSYRASSNNDVDVSLFAKKYNGGGHKKASGSKIEEYVKKEAIKMIFNDIVLEDKNAS